MEPLKTDFKIILQIGHILINLLYNLLYDFIIFFKNGGKDEILGWILKLIYAIIKNAEFCVCSSEDRVFDSDSKGRGFESRQTHHFALVS